MMNRQENEPIHAVAWTRCERCNHWRVRYQVFVAAGHYDRTCVQCLTEDERRRIDAWRMSCIEPEASETIEDDA